MIEITYYRPKWTCGRYDKEHHAAIIYNNISGMSYFFEDDSADVLAPYLMLERDKCITLQEISHYTNTAAESIIPFFHELEKNGLLSSVPITDEMVEDYRVRQSKWNCEMTRKDSRTTKEKLPLFQSNTEILYSEKVGGVTSVMFEMTYNCSEKCLHCYNPGANRNDTEKNHRGDRVELNIDDYKRIIDELYDEGLIKVCLSGGDPFSKGCVWELIDYLYNKNIAIDIFTNGQGIVNKTKQLADYFPRLIGLSLYSGSPSEHDTITRIKGSWEKTMKVLKDLSGYAVPLNLKCCIMRPNVKHYYQVAEIAKEYGAIPQFDVNVTDSVEGDKCVSSFLRLKPEQLEVVLRDDNVHLYVGEEAPNYGGQKKNMNEKGCGAGRNSFCISPEGYLMACSSLHAPFGNLKTTNLKNLLKNNKELTWWQSLTLNKYEECGKHEYCDFCNLCPGLNYSEHGTPTKASENCCYLAKVRYNLAIKMKKGYDPLEGKPLVKVLENMEDFNADKIQKVQQTINYCDKKFKING